MVKIFMLYVSLSVKEEAGKSIVFLEIKKTGSQEDWEYK